MTKLNEESLDRAWRVLSPNGDESTDLIDSGNLASAIAAYLAVGAGRRFRQPEELAYLALLKLPINGTMRADPAIQSAMAALRDRLAHAKRSEAEDVQDEYAQLAAVSQLIVEAG